MISNKLSCGFVLTLLMVVLALTIVDAGKGKGKGGWGKMNMTCKGETIDKQKVFQYLKDCKKEVLGDTTPSPQSDEQSDEAAESDESSTESSGGKKKWGKGRWGNTCVSVCNFKKNKVLDADGKYNSGDAESFINSIYPASVQADLKKGVDECASANEKSFSMDNKCEGYAKFDGCVRKTIMKTCGFGKNRKGGKKGKKNDDSTTEADVEE